MTKREFMKELEALLADIPENERNDAIQYYNDYFADGNIEDYMIVPESLGTPKQVADTIIKEGDFINKEPQSDNKRPVAPELNGTNRTYSNGNASQATGFNGDRANGSNYSYGQNTSGNTGYSGNGNNTSSNAQKSSSNRIAIIIIIALLTSPVWISVVTSVAGILFGIAAALFGCALGFGIGGAGVVAMAFMFSLNSIPAFIMTLGVGLFMIALGLIMVMLFVLFCGKLMPCLIKAIIQLCKDVTGSGKEQ